MNTATVTSTNAAADYAATAHNAAREAVKQFIASGVLPAPTGKGEAADMVETAARLFLAQDDEFRTLIGTAVWERVNA